MLNQNKNIFFIQGTAGKLETMYLPAQSTERGVAVVNHPNPTQGGTFTNKVIQTAAKALTQMGFHCYLPNLRGTGNSDGTHDYGRGETDDVVAVIDYAQAQHPHATQLAIVGFSFGGYVSTFAAQQRTPDLLLLIGAAVAHYPTPAPHVPDVRKTLFIHGADDEVVALSKPLQWCGEQDLPVIVLPNSSHFFHGKLIALRDAINRFVPAMIG
ncbi:alpha/beta hydrolase [Kingella kingae]|uniref:alpha/beta hydrolase n=1 Tax=Kingella kingae TaxID=504 RepID=UPI00254B8DA0|nr:alpha/beta fold hydrolase [Kingella kingae]MDK4574779.1 alpha/beta fold hydrolase [Kingella kingae]MDK4606919.1 alpha/beta fold hydrolase [Kingella kingae]